MSYYRKWTLFDNNEQCPLRRDAVVIAEHGPPLAGQFGIIGSMPPCAFPATLCQMIMPKHSNRGTNDGGAGRHTESSTGGDDRVSDRNAARVTALREPTPSMDSRLRLPGFEGNLKHLKKHYENLDARLRLLTP